MAEVKQSGNLSIPLNLRNAPTKLMKDLGYGNDYKYSHSYKNNFVEQDFMPKEIENKKFYEPQENTQEKSIRDRLTKWWKNRYKY
jgi:putative ATPase